MSDFYYDLEQVKSTLKCVLKNMYEVCLSSTDLSGYSVNKNYKLGINITTGKLFYVDEEGDWQPVPTVEGGDFTLEIEDTDTVDLSGEGTEANPLKADVKIDPDEDNLLSSTENGLLVTYEETDPTVGNHIKNITVDNIADWGEAYNWGDHSIVGYLLSETDPTVAAHIKAITNTDITNWNTAFGWGNHASAGYLTSLIAAGSTTEIQFNNAGAFAASNLLAWSTADSRLLLGNPSTLLVNAAETFVSSGDIRLLGGGINFALNSNSFNGFKSVGAGHGINIWTTGGNIGSFGGNGGSSGNGYLKISGEYNHSALTGTARALVVSGTITPVGISSAATNLVELAPTIQQIGSDPINHLGTGPVRGVYYNPTIGSLNGSDNIAFENTSGDIIHGNLAGVGDRMVVAEADGKLNTQAIPTQIVDYPEDAYTEIITWTGSVAPSGTINHRIIGQKVGNRVSLVIRLQYEIQGSVSQVNIPLPTTVPQPKLLAGMSMTPELGLYTANMTWWRNTHASTAVPRCYLTVNFAGTGFEIIGNASTAPVQYIDVFISYPVN